MSLLSNMFVNIFSEHFSKHIFIYFTIFRKRKSLLTRNILNTIDGYYAPTICVSCLVIIANTCIACVSFCKMMQFLVHTWTVTAAKYRVVKRPQRGVWITAFVLSSLCSRLWQVSVSCWEYRWEYYVSSAQLLSHFVRPGLCESS